MGYVDIIQTLTLPVTYIHIYRCTYLLITCENISSRHCNILYLYPQVRCSQSLRSGKYAAAVLAEQNNENQNAATAGDAHKRDRRDKRSSRQKFSRELLLPPMDYPDTVEAVFVRGACGRFARFAPFAKYVTNTLLIIYQSSIVILMRTILFADTF